MPIKPNHRLIAAGETMPDNARAMLKHPKQQSRGRPVATRRTNANDVAKALVARDHPGYALAVVLITRVALLTGAITLILKVAA